MQDIPVFVNGNYKLTYTKKNKNEIIKIIEIYQPGFNVWDIYSQLPENEQAGFGRLS